MDSFAEVIALWGTAESLAKDIGEGGVTVRAWRNRNSIPASRWMDVIAAAEHRGIDVVTLELLARLASRSSGGMSAPSNHATTMPNDTPQIHADEGHEDVRR